jgi:hypothetical protein
VEPPIVALIRELEEEGSEVGRLCAEALKELSGQVNTLNDQLTRLYTRINTGRIDNG